MKRAAPDLWYRIALVCGALPLGSGLLIFLLWLQTREHVLEEAGIWTIAMGCILFLIGGVALLGYCRTNREEGGWRTLLATLLLLANFPVAAVLAGAAWWLDSHYMITICNESGQQVKGAQVEGAGVIEHYGDIPPGNSVRHFIAPAAEGQLLFSSSGGTHNTVVVEYACSGLGGRRTVHVKPAGRVEVSK